MGNTIIMWLPVANVVSAFRMSNFSGQAIVVLLLIGSVFAWSIMATKFVELSVAERETRLFLEAYKNSRHPLFLFLKTGQRSYGPLYTLYRDICGQLAHCAGVSGRDPALLLDDSKAPLMKEYQLRAVRNLSSQLLAEHMLSLEKHMGILATAATAAPFLGLLGTVWGVMDAFGGLAMSASATLSAVAPGVSGALLTTVVGLVVALPSLIGYNILVGRIRKLVLRAERFVEEFMGDAERHFLREQ